MNGSRAGGCMGVPMGMSASADQRGGGRGMARTPWPLLPAGVSSNSLHRMLSELSYGQLTKDGLVTGSENSMSMQQPHNQLADDSVKANPFDLPAGSWLHPLQAALPLGCYSQPCVSGPKDSSAFNFAQHIALNGGSLVLDTSKGELVNASNMTPKEMLEAKALAASKSHSEAERRRRERINTHLATLRTLLPSSIKTDKAALLAEVIDQVKVLKHQVAKIQEYGPMPTDHDELSVERESSCVEGRLLIKASVCCNDRPDLMTDLKEALDTLQLRTLRAEISTLGGRVKNVFIVTTKEGSVYGDKDLSIKRVEDALRLVMDVPGGGETSPNKRQRVIPFESPP